MPFRKTKPKDVQFLVGRDDQLRLFRDTILKPAARLEDPITDLAGAFVQDLNQLADTLVATSGAWNKRSRRIILFFDTSVCSMVSRLQSAVIDLEDFLTVQPANELAQNILTLIKKRIEEVKHTHSSR